MAHTQPMMSEIDFCNKHWLSHLVMWQMAGTDTGLPNLQFSFRVPNRPTGMPG